MATKLSKPIILETTFTQYSLNEIIGEGGSGRVYGATSGDGISVAVKVLAGERASKDKRSRFKNEIAFLQRARHPNIVELIDYGLAINGAKREPFYVMRRYANNLRDALNASLPPERVLPIFSKIVDGVEAAHLLRAIHRDIKPENILFQSNEPAIADFGIAGFLSDIMVTAVETGDTQRLANFMYAAPEQRQPGGVVTLQSDIYALGLILNEMFTSDVPHGTDYQLIGALHPSYAYLDAVVARMIRQRASERYESLAAVKAAIAAHHAEFLSLQRLSEISKQVVPLGEIDDPLALIAPKLIDANYADRVLTLKLDQRVNPAWVRALHDGAGGWVGNYNPSVFRFEGDVAKVNLDRPSDAQPVVDHFKQWLPAATRTYKQRMLQMLKEHEQAARNKLQKQKETEEENLRINSSLRI